MRPDAVEHGVAELVVDDVGRQARVDALVAAIEVVELQRLALPVVVGVLAGAGVRNDDQPVALEPPGNAAPEAEPAFEEIERALHDGPHIHLVELRRLGVAPIERRAVRGQEASRSLSQRAGGASVSVWPS